MWFRLLAVLLLVATAAVAGWIVLWGVIWVDGGERVVALASAWEIVGVGLLGVALAWAAIRLRGRLRVVGVLGVGALLALVLLREVLPRRPEVAGPGEAEVEQPAARMLWICVDGLSWSRVLPLAAEGRMPHMRRLLDTGVSAVLESEATYRESEDRWGWWSPVIWTSLATGRRPRAHGITDFSLPDPTRPVRRNGKPRMRAAASFHRRVPAFWNLWTAFGRSVGVIGWWGSWPAEKVSGVLVTDRVGLHSRQALAGFDPSEGVAWFGDRKGLTYPPSFLRVVAEDVGLPEDPVEWVNGALYPFDRRPIVDRDELATIYAVVWQDRLYVRVGERLLHDRPDLGLVTVYIEGVDVLSHHFWHYMADPDAEPGLPLVDDDGSYRTIVDRYLETLDAYLGRLLEAAGEGTRIVLTSDHGFRLTPDTEFPADHSPYGVLLLAGDGVREGTEMSLAGALAPPATVLDVLPTLLYWNGLPLADELDGTPLYRLFERGYLRDHPAVRIDSYGDFEENREVEIPLPDASDKEYRERLKALGYIQ